MDLRVLIMNIFIGILISPQVTAKRLLDCTVNDLADYCGFAQDRTDSFDWTIKQWIIDVRRAAPEEPHGYYLTAARSKGQGRAGQNAFLHTPYYSSRTSSTLSIRFRLKIEAADGTQLKVFVSHRSGRKVQVLRAVSRGRGFRDEFRTITVSQQFRVSFEAILGSSARSAVSIDDIEIDIFPQTIQAEPNLPTPTIPPDTTGVAVDEKTKEKEEETSGKDDSVPLCFVIALVSSSILAVFLIMCVVLCVFAVKTNSFAKRSGHQYEVIYSEQSTMQSSMESSLQLSLRRQRHRTATTTSSSMSRLLQRISYSMSSARNSHQSSIYAEIADANDSVFDESKTQDDEVALYIVGNRSTGTVSENSFFSTLSRASTEETQIKEPFALDIPEKVKEALFLPYIPQKPKSKRTSPVIPWRAPQEVDAGWVDNIIYEGSLESNKVPGRQIIGMQTLRPQPSPKEVDLSTDYRLRGFTF